MRENMSLDNLVLKGYLCEFDDNRGLEPYEDFEDLKPNSVYGNWRVQALRDIADFIMRKSDHYPFYPFM